MDASDTQAKAAPIIIIEGEIGAGKTELTKAIAAELKARGLNVCVVLEPVDKWKEVGALQMFYADPARHAYGFQTYVYATRIMAIDAAVRAHPAADVYILERSPATDLIFMELQRDVADPVEMRMYETWCESWRLMIPIDLAAARVLYLKTSLGHCMSRVAQRHRDGEIRESKGTPAEEKGAAPAERSPASATGGVSIEYQARLRRAHEAFLQGLHADEFPLMPKSPFAPSSVIAIEPALADGNFRDEGAERTRIVAAIIEKVGL